MEGFVGDDEDAVSSWTLVRGQLLFGDVKHLAFGGLAGLVLGFESGGDFEGPGTFGGGEKFDGFAGVAHAAGGIEARGQREADGDGVKLAASFGSVAVAGGGDEGLEAGELRAGELGEAIFDEDAILPDQGDDIGDGAEGGEGSEFQKEIAVGFGDAFGVAEGLGDGPREFEGDASAAEVGVGVGGGRVVSRQWSVVRGFCRLATGHWPLGQSGVDDGAGRREFCGEFVVIGNDDIHVLLAGQRDGGDGRNPAVDGDEELGAALAPFGTAGVDDRLHGIGIEAVAFIDAVGDVDVDVGPGGFESMPEHGGAGDAVDVVVSVECNLVLFANGAGGTLGGGAHVGQEPGRVEIFELRFEEGGGGGGIGEAAVDEEAGDEGGEAELACEGFGAGGIVGGEDPFLAAVGSCGGADHP